MFGFVWVKTLTTVLTALGQKRKGSTALKTKRIERAIAKKTVKVIRIGPLVAGEIRTSAVAEVMRRGDRRFRHAIHSLSVFDVGGIAKRLLQIVLKPLPGLGMLDKIDGAEFSRYIVMPNDLFGSKVGFLAEPGS